MGNAVVETLGPASDDKIETIKQEFGVDTSNLKPGVVVLILDAKGQACFHVNHNVPDEEMPDLAGLTTIASAFVERITQDDEFCQEMADWAEENLPSEDSLAEDVTEDGPDEPVTAETVSRGFHDLEDDTPKKRVLH